MITSIRKSYIPSSYNTYKHTHNPDELNMSIKNIKNKVSLKQNIGEYFLMWEELIVNLSNKAKNYKENIIN